MLDDSFVSDVQESTFQRYHLLLGITLENLIVILHGWQNVRESISCVDIGESLGFLWNRKERKITYWKKWTMMLIVVEYI